MSRRFQFNLKELLLLVAVVAIFSFILFSIRETRSPFLTPSEKRATRTELDRLADEAQAAHAGGAPGRSEPREK